jgi:hypothetical protein
MGILAGVPHEDNSPLNILLARQHHNNNKYYDKIQEKDIIKIKILGKRYEYGDTQISIIGVLYDGDDDDDINENSNNNSNDNSNEN